MSWLRLRIIDFYGAHLPRSEILEITQTDSTWIKPESRIGLLQTVLLSDFHTQAHYSVGAPPSIMTRRVYESMCTDGYISVHRPWARQVFYVYSAYLLYVSQTGTQMKALLYFLTLLLEIHLHLSRFWRRTFYRQYLSSVIGRILNAKMASSSLCRK